MSEQETPQLYLITPEAFELQAFSAQLSSVLDEVEIACLRLSLATKDEDRISRSADLVREIAHARDIPVILDTHYLMVERLGLDGVHLQDGARSVRAVRKELGTDLVVGAFCGVSRHDGLTAGEIGCDYIAFGPMAQNALGDGSVVDRDLFEWWSQMIELPVVAEGALSPEVLKDYAEVSDFFALGPEIWNSDNPTDAIKTLTAPLR